MSHVTFVRNILQELVDHPGDVRISDLEGEKTTIMEIRCHAEDVGKVIGKNGKTISAIRTLLSMVAARDGRKAMVEVVE